MFEWLKKVWQRIKNRFTKKSEQAIQTTYNTAPLAPSSRRASVSKSATLSPEEKTPEIKERATATVKRGREVASDFSKTGRAINQASKELQKPTSLIDIQISKINAQLVKARAKLKEESKKTQDREHLKILVKPVVMLKKQLELLGKQKARIQTVKQKANSAGTTLQKAGALMESKAKTLEYNLTKAPTTPSITSQQLPRGRSTTKSAERGRQ